RLAGLTERWERCPDWVWRLAVDQSISLVVGHCGARMDERLPNPHTILLRDKLEHMIESDRVGSGDLLVVCIKHVHAPQHRERVTVFVLMQGADISTQKFGQHVKPLV